MAPIRLALIGLSQAAKTSWAAQGHLPYLLSDRGRERYKIVALLNSSEDAAKRAIDDYKLGDVKAYGSPQALAEDKEVDIVVCTTRVDVHYSTIKPSLEAGKAVFVEWPLAENVKRAKELASLAEQKQAPTIIGLQARVAPVVLKVKELLKSGVIGKVLSSEVKASSLYTDRDSISEGLAYFLDKKVGGNPVTITLGHMSDFVHSVLGEYESFNAHPQIQRPKQTVISYSAKPDSYDPDRKTAISSTRQVTSDVPDLVYLHGTLATGHDYVAEGASLQFSFRTGPPFPGTLPFEWLINGEKGEIRVTSERGPFLQSEASAFPIPIQVHDFASGEVRNTEWGWEDWQEDRLPRGRNIGKLYDLYYEGRLAEYGCADFQAAVKRHEVLDSILWS